MTVGTTPASATTLSCNTLLSFHWVSSAALLEHLTPHGGLILSIFLILIVAAQYVRSPWRKVPPGPKGLPILGNALQLKDKLWMFKKDCKQKFQNIMYLNALGQPFVVLNSLKSASELLDRRANIYSDRPRVIIGHEILCGGLFLALIPYGDVWRRHRRAAHEALTKFMVRDYHPTYRKEAINLASSILDNPEALTKHLSRASASATMSILYDYPTLEDEHDKTLTEIHAFINRLSAANAPGAYLVEFFPWMMHIPERFAKWKREGMEHFRQHTAMFNRPLNAVHHDIASQYASFAQQTLLTRYYSQAKGSERPSVSASLIKNCNQSGLSHDEIVWLLGTLYIAGAETTSTSMMWWVLAMIAHPEIQKRAQDQLDLVVGRFRPPTFADALNLPYIQALVKETLRWRPALPLGVAHSTTEDDWYEGMFIPKNTICLANVWQCNHDPAYYGDDAASFNPERFLDEHGKLIPGPVETRDDGHSSYGFGRRACVGKHAGNDTLFVSMATVLWAMRLESPRDESGKEVPLDTETPVDIGTVFRPVPYRCNATPRFPEAPLLLAEQLELMKET